MILKKFINNIKTKFRTKFRKFLFSDEEIFIGADYNKNDACTAIVCRINKKKGTITVISDYHDTSGHFRRFDMHVRELARRYNGTLIRDMPLFFKQLY